MSYWLWMLWLGVYNQTHSCFTANMIVWWSGGPHMGWGCPW